MTEYVNCLVKQFAICLGVVVILLFNVMKMLWVGGCALLDRQCMVFQRMCVLCLYSFHRFCLCFCMSEVISSFKSWIRGGFSPYVVSLGGFAYYVVWKETAVVMHLPLWYVVYVCQRVECAFTSPVMTECGVFVVLYAVLAVLLCVDVLSRGGI